MFSTFRHPLPAPPAFAEQRSSRVGSPAASVPAAHALHAAQLQPRGHDAEDEEYYLALARHKVQQHSSSSTSPAGLTASPGPGIRRLAESFLDSIGDESSPSSGLHDDAATAARRMQQQQQQTAGHSRMQSQGQLQDSGHAGHRDGQQAGRLLYEERVLHAGSGGEALASMRAELMERKRREVDEMLLSLNRKQQQQLAAARAELGPSVHSAASSVSSTSWSPTPSPPSSRPSSDPSSASLSASSSPFLSLHGEILCFAATCQHLQQHQSALRDDLCQRTRRAVQSVWPSAEVDLVGSVSAGVALPKSDLDFVVFFPVSGEADSRPPYTFSAPIDDDGHASLDPAAISRQQAEAAEQSRPMSSSRPVHHFAHAGSLIKLLGGRKKSKLLFRSTKIQVFKDINLIRLRDGCSGVSMDLWFPTSSFITLRSQQHTRLIASFLTAFPFFYPLAVVIKSFMQQQMLNSGYSGLGSYGVLLMIVRFLQHQRDAQRKREDRDRDSNGNDGSSSSNAELPPMESVGKERNSSSSSTCSTSSAFSASASSFSSLSSSSAVLTADNNLGRALCEFFRFYCVFDYAAKAIDVRGDGCFMDKPELSAIQRKAKAHAGPAAQPSMGDDDDDADNNSEDEQAERADGSSEAAAADSSAESSCFIAFTLVIQDPLDVNNFILCHHRALRNMVQAFMQAISILDPDSPLPAPAAALVAPSPQAGQTMTASHAASASAAMFHTQYAQLPPSAGIGRSTSDIVYPTSLITLPSHHTSPAGSPSSSPSAPLSRFQRLLDVQAAYAGPAMKDCPSASCRLMSPPNLCPIQNKVCFGCGYMFVKNQSGGLRHQHQSRGGKKRSTGHGGAAAANSMGGAGGGGGGAQGGRSRMNGLTGLANGAQQQPQQHTGGFTAAGHPALLNGGQLQRGRSDKQHQQLQHPAYLQQQHLGGTKPFNPRSGFSTEPSSPTFHSPSHSRHQQRQYSRGGPSTTPASASSLLSQNGAYTHSAGTYSPSSPPLTAAHGSAAGMAGHLSPPQATSSFSAGSSPHMPTSAASMTAHATAFTRTQSHPVQSVGSLSPYQHAQQPQLPLQHSLPSSAVRSAQQQQQLGYGGGRSGATMSQAAPPAFELPFMSSTRYRASSANEPTAAMGSAGRRQAAVSPPSLSPPMSASRYVNHHSAAQHQQPSYGLQPSSSSSSPFASLPPQHHQQQQQQQQLFSPHHGSGFQ